MKNTKNGKISSTSSNNKIWLYGKHAVLAALENPERHCHQLLLTRNANQELEAHEHITEFKQKTKLIVTDPKFIDNLFLPGTVHQGIALEVSPLPDIDLDDFIADRAAKNNSCILILDQVTDPHNVGAVLRSASAFSVDAVLTTQRHSPQETGTLAKIACGGLEFVPLIKVSNLVSALITLKESGYWCVGLDGEAKAVLGSNTAFAKTALILGAEDKGLRRLTRTHCDLMVKLPTTGKIRSLNVSNAAAIALYAVTKPAI